MYESNHHHMKTFINTIVLAVACSASVVSYLREPKCCIEASEPIVTLATGNAVPTGNPLDLHIQGPGFFAAVAFDGSYRYMRHGSFRRNAEGYLGTSEGYDLEPRIHVPEDVEEVIIHHDGLVYGQFEGEVMTLGQVGLFTFEDPDALLLDWDGTFRPTPSSGPATAQNPGLGGAGWVRQGFLESPRATLVVQPSGHDRLPEHN